MKTEMLGRTFAVRVDGIDVNKLSDSEFAALEKLFYDKGVMAISGQTLSAPQLRDFAARFGKVYRNPTTPYAVNNTPEIMILSNKKNADGARIGQSRAGENWHTDMSYNAPAGRITMLYGEEVPFVNGIAQGNTQFADMYAAYEALPAEMKAELKGAVGLHDFYYAYNRTIKYENKKTLTPEQVALRPPVRHPILAVHPDTGRTCLYVNNSFTKEIEGFDPARSQELLDFLFAFQTRPEFFYSHVWRQGDLVLWDDLSTVHRATLDYDDTVICHMLRAQVEGNTTLAAAF